MSTALDPRYLRLRSLFPIEDRAPSLTEAVRIQREIAELLAADNLSPPLQPLRMACLRSVTVEPLVPQIVAAMAGRDFAATVELGGLGNHLCEAASDDSFLFTGGFDVCIFLVSAESVLAGLNDPQAGFHDLDAEIGAFLHAIDSVASSFAGLIVVCNFALSDPPLARRFQSQRPESARYAVAKANQLLAAQVQNLSQVVLCDLEYLAQRLGTAQFFSPRNMAAVVQPFSTLGFHHVASEWADLCRLHFRGPAKCVVVDCDNTLWQGIVGEDGVHGIRLGEGYPGVCYQQFQRQLKNLRNLGFLLAINTKNNEADIRAAFAGHPGMVLKLDDFAAVRANWANKADNMESIAAELNLGLESFLFIDDSPFELEHIRTACPGIECHQVPAEPWKLPELLPGILRADCLRITAEDRQKSEMYRQEQDRKAIRGGASNIEDYLRELDLEMTVETFQPHKHLDRTVQLLQKTNQFNLTTRRHDAAAVLEMVRAGAMVRLAALRDRFGDYGRIALAIVTFSEGVPWLDTFLMSCRAIGRRAETMFLSVILQQLREEGFALVRGEYLSTPRNQVCASFLAEQGFREIKAGACREGKTFERDLSVEFSAAESFYRLQLVNS